MVYIDTHAHLELINNLDKAIDNAKKNNVKIIIANSVNKKTITQTLNFSKKYKTVKTALGLYPSNAVKLSDKEINNIISLIKKNKDSIIAIGEVGLDLQELKTLSRQQKIFEKFIKLSIDLNIPIIVHSRHAESSAIELLEKNHAKKVIMHCFNGKSNLVKHALKLGYYFSIPTNVKHSTQMQELVKLVPLDKMFCETDSPFLSPIKGYWKDNPNQPLNVIESYKMISKIKNLPLKTIEKTIEKNYNNLFKQS